MAEPSHPHRTAREELTGDPRVYFAGERTLLAWVRTGIALMGFGFVVARFGLFLRQMAEVRGDALPPGAGHPGRGSMWFGTALVLLGVAVNVIAAAQHFRFLRRFRAGEPLTKDRVSLGIVLSCLLAALGLAMAGYLIVVR